MKRVFELALTPKAGIGVGLALCFALMGCANMNASWLNFVGGMNERKIQSCLDTDITVAGGGGLGAGVNGSVHARGITITGGMTLQECAEYKSALQQTGG